MQSEETVKITVSVERVLKKRLKLIADREDMTLSELVRQCLRMGFAEFCSELNKYEVLRSLDKKNQENND